MKINSENESKNKDKPTNLIEYNNDIKLPEWTYKLPVDFQELYYDILSTRTLNPVQEQVIDCFFKDNCGRIFLRIGRKGSKTSTIILVAWLFSHFRGHSTVTNILYPTKEQGYDVMWEEKRLQNCDLMSFELLDKYVDEIDDKRMSVNFRNGSLIRIHGTWAEKRGRGVQPDLLIPDELKDINPEFLAGFEPNLAAKPDSRFLLAGTPPKKRNHYHEWEERSIKKLGAKHFHFSSYINTSLPHLKKWLDDTRDELKAAGKEDEWKREYLAEDCFSSEDRVLPDANFIEHEEMLDTIATIDQKKLTYVVGVKMTPSKLCAVYFAIERRGTQSTKIYVLDHLIKKNIWNGSLKEFINQIPTKSALYGHKDYSEWRKWVCDYSNAFESIIRNFNVCSNQKDYKWQVRGIPLMREMMHEDTLIFSNNVYPIGLEIQGLLIDEDFEEYPLVSVCGMIVNEYHHEPKYLPGIKKEMSDVEKICESLNLKPPQKKKGERLFSWKWNK